MMIAKCNPALIWETEAEGWQILGQSGEHGETPGITIVVTGHVRCFWVTHCPQMSGVHISEHKIKKPLTGSLHGDNWRILELTPNTCSCKAIPQNPKLEWLRESVGSLKISSCPTSSRESINGQIIWYTGSVQTINTEYTLEGNQFQLSRDLF